MGMGMREPYVEGVAIHSGPESGVGVREGAGEALTGVRAGRAIEPRNGENDNPIWPHCAGLSWPHSGYLDLAGGHVG
jgi:hypothetical protein